MVFHSPYIPIIIALAGIIFVLLGRRALRLKKATGFSGKIHTSPTLYYYWIIMARHIGGSVLLVIGGKGIYQFWTWWGLTLYILLLVGLGVIFYRAGAIRTGFWNGVKRLFRGKPKPPKPSPRVWALAAVAIIARIKGHNYYLLGGANPSPSKERSAKRKLKKEWEIEDKEDFDEIQEWLFETGHRTGFYALVDKISKASHEEIETYLTEIEQGSHDIDNKTELEEERYRVHMVRNDRGALKTTGFLAWDYLRYMDNCRTGFMAGYLDETEAWDHLLSAAQVLQSRFDSWQELGASFLAGREFWSIVETRKDGDVYLKSYQSLLDDGKSPWGTVRWEMALYSRK